MEIIITGIITLIIGGTASYFIWDMILKKTKQKLLADAEIQAEMLKEKKMLQSREKFIQLKSEHESYINERNLRIASAENKLKQKETIYLQRKEELQHSIKELELSEREIDTIRENLNIQLELVEQKDKSGIVSPKNLKEQAISLVGTDIYKKLIEGYTEKQWGRKATDLPAFIIKRLPVRFTYDNNYYNDPYQGVPIGGYNILVNGLLEGVNVRSNCDFFTEKDNLIKLAKNIVFTGRIDEYYEFAYGKLEYRSLRFEDKILNTDNFQGHPVINYTDAKTSYTRIIEHKHFEFGTQPKTVITKEYPLTWKDGREVYYPVNDEKNNALYEKYKQLADKESNVIFGGRLAEYKYYDMNQVIEKALGYKF